jgi:uncharacterized lipoprotein YmbA
MRFRILTLLLLNAGLMGCVTSSPAPESFHYILDNLSASNSQTEAPAENLSTIKVLPINLPDYLRQPNLVLKLSDHQVKIANYHYWAEDLTISIQRVVLKELNASTTTSYTSRCTQCDELAISIDHFYPTEQGDVVLSGSYELVSQDGTTSTNNYSLSKKLSSGGYNDAVATMRILLGDLAQQITK